MRRLEALQGRLGKARLLLAALAIALAWLAGYGHISVLWALAPAVVFAGAVVQHTTVRRRHSRAVRAAAFYRGGLARIHDRRVGGGRQGRRFDDLHHVHAGDLDLFGPGSLFELTCSRAPRARAWESRRWRGGCWHPLRPRRTEYATLASRTCGAGSRCGKTWRRPARMPAPKRRRRTNLAPSPRANLPTRSSCGRSPRTCSRESSASRSSLPRCALSSASSHRAAAAHPARSRGSARSRSSRVAGEPGRAVVRRRAVCLRARGRAGRFRLRDGVVTASNGLALMRAIGLRV